MRGDTQQISKYTVQLHAAISTVKKIKASNRLAPTGGEVGLFEVGGEAGRPLWGGNTEKELPCKDLGKKGPARRHSTCEVPEAGVNLGKPAGPEWLEGVEVGDEVGERGSG